MEELSYSQIQKIEMSATKKLLNYISKEIEDEKILDKIDFFFPDFSEQKHRLAFNIWLSIDFVGKDGKTFIEKFLSDKSSGLTVQEKEILIQRNKSNISLFEVLYVEGEYIKVLDLLQNQSYNLWEPELASTIVIGDFIFARISNLLGNMTFMGDISYLPPSIKDMFLEEVFMDFNHLRLVYPKLTIKEYLKSYSLHLYKIYTNCIFEAMERDEDIISILYDELDEFEAYLLLKNSRSEAKKHISNLMDFFEYYLADEDLTLYDFDQIDFDFFFRDAIEEGFLTSQEDLNSYISTFKKYLGFLSNRDSEYKEAYKELLHISKNRFEFMNQFKLIKSPFRIDKDLSQAVSSYLDDGILSLLMDYDKFMLYILDKPLDLTSKNKYIKKINLLEINRILEFSSYTDKKSPNQKDFPLIHLFYMFSIHLGLLSVNEDILSATKKGTNFLRLKDEDKYALFFQYIWSNDFLTQASNISNTNILEKLKKDLIDLFSSLNENKSYEISSISPIFSNHPRFFFEYYIYLQYLNVIQCVLYPNYEIKITTLGKILINFLKSRNSKKNECSIIHLEAFRKSK